MQPRVKMDKVTSALRWLLFYWVYDRWLYPVSAECDGAFLGARVRQVMEAYDEYHALLAKVEEEADESLAYNQANGCMQCSAGRGHSVHAETTRGHLIHVGAGSSRGHLFKPYPVGQ